VRSVYDPRNLYAPSCDSGICGNPRYHSESSSGTSTHRKTHGEISTPKPAEHHDLTLGHKEVQLLKSRPETTKHSLRQTLTSQQIQPIPLKSRWAISPPRKMALAPNSQSLASKWSFRRRSSRSPFAWQGGNSSKWEPLHPFTRELRRLQTSVSQALCFTA
jgi:hypothetical protein